jgi:SAM-dependent methyltransferase
MCCRSLRQAAAEIPEAAQDQAALQLTLRKRQDKSRAFFDDMAGRFGREYVPGRSWKGIAEALLKLMPPMVIADLGAGEGTFSLLLAQRAQHVIAVDNSDKMVEYGPALGQKQGVKALEYRKGRSGSRADRGRLGRPRASSASRCTTRCIPERAVAEAWRILKREGRIAVLDLVQAPLRRGARTLRRRLAGLQRSRTRSPAAKAGFQNVQTDLSPQRNRSPLLSDIAGGRSGDSNTMW